MVLEKLRQRGLQIRERVIGAQHHVGFDHDQVGMLVAQSVLEKIISFRGLGRSLAQIEGSVSLLMPQVHGGDADHGQAVSDVIDIDRIPGDRGDLRVPGVAVLDQAGRKPLAGIEQDPRADKDQRQEKTEGKDLQELPCGYGIR